MQYKIVNTNEIKMVGIEHRLNLNDVLSVEKIGNLWKKFFAEDIPSQIKDVAEPIKTIGLYTHYDRDGNYALIPGCIVNSLNNIPEGMKGYTVPAAKYALFTIDIQSPKVIADFWQELWTHKDTLGFTRAFTKDFELYDHRFSSNKPEMYIYISVL